MTWEGREAGKLNGLSGALASRWSAGNGNPAAGGARTRDDRGRAVAHPPGRQGTMPAGEAGRPRRRTG